MDQLHVSKVNSGYGFYWFYWTEFTHCLGLITKE